MKNGEFNQLLNKFIACVAKNMAGEKAPPTDPEDDMCGGPGPLWWMYMMGGDSQQPSNTMAKDFVELGRFISSVVDAKKDQETMNNYRRLKEDYSKHQPEREPGRYDAPQHALDQVMYIEKLADQAGFISSAQAMQAVRDAKQRAEQLGHASIDLALLALENMQEELSAAHKETTKSKPPRKRSRKTVSR